MKYEETQKLERYDHNTGKFEVVETLDDISVYHILSVFSAEEKIYLRTVEMEKWTKYKDGVLHIEFD
tara:strand:+ start:657 stop:857 length:201 start_codon:yes stop_codon:yes gene_type:complete